MEEGTVFQPKPQGSLRPGVRLNGMFEIERLIAEGGMGEVYKGAFLASGDPVAIKLVRPEMSRQADVMALFKREAAILHNLVHDAIVRYYVFSIEPELQRAYIAMEFVDGVSLQNRLASGPLSPAEVRVLLKRIGGALELAHANGVVHRDISSDNIILPNGDPRRAKIVDFGIARDAQAPEGTIIGGGLAGKYKYMSPEQLGLAGGIVTPKSDVYSFGLVIAEALRGQAIDMGKTQAEVIEKRKRVPDLSDIDVSLRPLLTAMLAPNPSDRPANMAEVAAWGETGERTQATLAPKPPERPPSRRLATLLAVAGALVVAVPAIYRLYTSFAPNSAPTVAASPGATLPPLPTASPSPTVATASPTATPTATPTPTSAAIETPSKQALLEQLPPRASQEAIALAPAVTGTAMAAQLPAFVDPGLKGLALHAAPSPPPGLTLHDLGGGHSALEGTPAAAGKFAFDVVAVNPNGKSARMRVTLEVAPASPILAQSAVDLEPATAGAAYSAGLPPFRSAQKLTLRAEGLPEGLAFADLGGGFSQISGAPAKAGRYAFAVVATAAGGGAQRMTVNLDVAPAAPPSSPLQSPPMRVALASFLAAHAAEPCFFAWVDDARLIGVGDDRAAFERFAAEYKRTFQAEPDVRAELVTPAQCPVVALLKSLAAAEDAPRLSLDSVEVGKGQPLSGAITGLGKRTLTLVAVGDDGRAVKVRAPLADDGQSASFNLGLTGDADSRGKPQLLLALASDRPLAGLETFRAGPAADLTRKVQTQARGVAAALAQARRDLSARG